MGGSPSRTRKLIVENDDPTSVIKVSDDVVERIRGNQNQPIPLNEPQATWSNPAQPQVGGPGGYLYEPSLTSLQIRQDNVAELKKNDDYWQKRVRNVEKNQRKMNEVMDQEYNKALQEFQGKTQSPAKKFQPPCQDTKRAVLECYKKNPNETMNCAKLVQAFQECVDLKRTDVISNRG